MTRTACCCCGDCTITVEGAPVLNALCHCTSCRRRTGSAFGWSAYFPDDKIAAKAGTLNVYARDGATGYNRFSARCGTTLFWKSFGFLPDATGIAGGGFIDDPLPEPNLPAQDRDHCTWLTLPENWLKA